MAKLQFATLSNLQEFLNLHNVSLPLWECGLKLK